MHKKVFICFVNLNTNRICILVSNIINLLEMFSVVFIPIFSGMAAANAVMETLQQGDHIIASKQVKSFRLFQFLIFFGAQQTFPFENNSFLTDFRD